MSGTEKSMKEENPLVSIVVRTKDRPKLLVRALQSIARQTYTPIEVVLVNDGGCELPVEELKSLLGAGTLRYVRLEKNAGRAGAGNRGIHNAQGKYIGFLDDDDEFYPEHAALLVSALEQIDYNIAYTDSELAFIEYDPVKKEFYEKEKKSFSKKDFSYPDLIVENYIPLINLLFRREVLLTIGGFDETLELFEDWDLLIRSAEKNPFYHIKQVTSRYMQWSKDLQIAQPEGYQRVSEIAYDRVISKHLDKYHSLEVVRHFREIAHRLVQASFHLAEQEEIIAHKDAVIREKHSTAVQYEDLLREKEKLISRLEAEMGRNELQLEHLKHELREKDSLFGEAGKIIEGKDNQIMQVEKIIQGKNDQISQFEKIIRGKDSQLVASGEMLKRRDEQISDLETRISRMKSRMDHSENSQKEIQERDRQILQLKAQVMQFEALKEKEIERAHLETVIDEKDALIATMANTLGWQLLVKFRKTRDRFLPVDSGRRQLYDKASRIAKNVMRYGLSGLKAADTHKDYPVRQEDAPPPSQPVMEGRYDTTGEVMDILRLNSTFSDRALHLKADKQEIAKKLESLKLELLKSRESHKNEG
jgi:glycosyltransferase involved in cell wall biosynthesis